jgi:LysR family transcriptional regulator, low CO2-responsive transcriptional regulator
MPSMSNLSLLASLKAFDATVRAGTMVAAAKALDLQQPTLSAHIARLESEFGVELFYRRGRKLELTPFGVALHEYATRIFRAEEDTHEFLIAARNQFRGRLTICAVGPYNVTPIIKRFAQQRPLVTIVVSVGDSKEIVERITGYHGDIGVLVHAVDDPHLHCVPYREQPLVVFAPTTHPLAERTSVRMRDLHQQSFVMREKGSTTRRVFEQALQESKIAVRVSLEMGSREAVREAVAQGLGLGIVADSAYVPDPRIVRLPIEDRHLATHCHIICRTERRQVPLIADFLKTAQQMQSMQSEGVAASSRSYRSPNRALGRSNESLS